MKYLLTILLLGFGVLQAQQIIHNVTPNGADFDYSVFDDSNNAFPTTTTDYGTLDSVQLNTRLMTRQLTIQQQLGRAAATLIIVDHEARNIYSRLSTYLGISEQDYRDSITNIYQSSLNGVWNYRIIGTGNVDIEITDANAVIESNQAQFGTMEFLASNRIIFDITHNSVGEVVTLSSRTPSFYVGEDSSGNLHIMEVVFQN